MSARDLPAAVSPALTIPHLIPPHVLAQQRAIVGGSLPDPFAQVWNGWSPEQRSFWLIWSRQSHHLAGRKWCDISGAERAILKNNLYRAAKELQKIAAYLEPERAAE